MALEADRILRGGSPHLLGFHRSVHVVAVAALDQPFVHAMMEWHVKLGFLLKMAGIAQLGLGLYQQELGFGRMMRRMAGDAADVILGMLRVDGIHMLRAAGMADKAAIVDLFCRVILKNENLGLVTTAFDMS